MYGTEYYYTDSANVEFVVTEGQACNYPWHMHAQHWTLGLVRSGTVTLATGVGTQRLCSGQRFYVHPYVPHSLQVAPDSSLLVICCGAMDAFSADAGVLCGISSGVPLLRGHEEELADALAQVYAENPLPEMADCRDALMRSDSLVGLSVWAVSRRMLDDPDSFVDIEHMAAYAGYSPWHFLRAFQKNAGMTPHAFQLLCRLRLLRRLLRANAASAAAAAFAGFSDQSHMHKVFKRHHAMTPGQFRQASFKLGL